MRISEGKLENLTCRCGTITDTYKLHLFLITFGNAVNHVRDQSAIKSVHGAVLTLVVGTRNYYMAVFYGNLDIGIDLLYELPFRTFYSHFISFNLYGYAGRYRNRCFTYS